MEPVMDNSGEVARHRRAVPLSTAELDALIPAYEFTDYIDSGGMGAVYKAVQKSLNRVVAVKLLPKGHLEKEGFKERFKREAEALARLNHPNIISVYDCGETAEGQMYYVMEFVSGMDLHHLLRRDPPGPQKIVQIIAQVCEALQHAHEQGIVHRDIKPANILVDDQGRVKVADFGLAKILGEEVVHHTAVGTAMGTPEYIAPEALENSARVDHRADIYSLGVVTYELFTGLLPKGEWDPPSRCSGTDKRVDTLVSRALQQNPDKRYQSVNDITQVLNVLLKNCDWRHYHRASRSIGLACGKEEGAVASGTVTVKMGQRSKAGRGARWAGVLVLVAGMLLAVAWQAGWLQRQEVVVPAALPKEAAAAESSSETAAPDQLKLAAWILGQGGTLNVLTPETMWQVEGPEVHVSWPPPLVPVSRARVLMTDRSDIHDMSDLPLGLFVIWRVSFQGVPLTEAPFAGLVDLLRAADTVSHLNLSGLEVPTRSLQKLADLPSLRSLDITRSTAVTPEALPFLAACTQLRLLRLGGGGSRVNEAMLSELRARLPGCGVHDDF